jgi:SAM-dependent methyltransferase
LGAPHAVSDVENRPILGYARASLMGVSSPPKHDASSAAQRATPGRPAAPRAGRSDTPWVARTQPIAALFLVSVAGLFIELMLIRWIGTEIRIFAYLQNTILVVCFFGLGYGCYSSRRPIRMMNAAAALAVLVFALAFAPLRSVLQQISQNLSVLGDFTIWEFREAAGAAENARLIATGLALTLAMMFVVLEVFIPFGRLLGRLMDDHPRPILAYSVNVAGSLVGIWLFVLMSWLYCGPAVWVAAAALLCLPLLGGTLAVRSASLTFLALAVGFSWPAGGDAGAQAVYWSPYQKLVLFDARGESAGQFLYKLAVNDASYQLILDLGPEDAARNPRRNPPVFRGYSQYDLPVRLHAAPRDVLIVGSGTGNDVAGALRNGAGRVTAVEIDPAIVELGRRFHPERPYDSPRVRLIVDDARAWFAAADERYDVICFGLLDAHTTTAMTNARLDHYVYTIESIRQARELLKPGGIVALSFEVRRPWIGDRIARTLRDVFGHEPLSFRIPVTDFGWGGVMFIAGDLDAVRRRIDGDPFLPRFIDDWRRLYPQDFDLSVAPATDDWPYLYLDKPRVPMLYFLLGGLLVALLARCAGELKPQRLLSHADRTQAHFFFLGAAFLLLEVQNISKASVALGNTWSVNAVIISGVLCMILLANGLARLVPRLPLSPVYALLCGACLALYFVDLAPFASLPYAAKAVLVGGLTTLPMLFSGIVFIRSFAAVSGRDAALGANMIGALFGGLLQSLTFLTGMRALLLIVAGLYALALLTRPKAGPAGAPAGT